MTNEITNKQGYIIVSDNDIFALKRAVNEYTKEGYIPAGGIAFAATTHGALFLQAMVSVSILTIAYTTSAIENHD